jgi:hypothetical protein
MNSPESKSDLKGGNRILLYGWIAFIASVPVGCAVGWGFAHGQDAAGAGIGFAIGFLGVGLLGGMASAIFISRITVRLIQRRRVARTLAFLPWIVWAWFWWVMLLTPTGDRFAE